MNESNSTGNIPNYSFWAEQIPPGNHSNEYPYGNAYSYEEQNMNREELKKNEGTNEKSRIKPLSFLLKAFCFGIIASISFIGFYQLYSIIMPDAVKGKNIIGFESKNGFELPQKEYKLEVTKPGNSIIMSSQVVSDVINDTMPAIVAINSISNQSSIWFGQEFTQPMEGSGSGIIVGRNEKELLIATNNHVVEGTQEISVTFIDDKKANAIIKGTDATADLAVITVDISELKKDTLDNIKVVKLGNSDSVKVGEMSIAIGNALGYGQSVTVGYVSAKDRKVDVSDGFSTKSMVLLQTDAAINPGNSGGALVNIDGEVIGINTVKYFSNQVEGMGYAIPISKATPIINDLMTREILKEEEQGFLGLSGDDVTEDVSEALNIPIGVYVGEIIKDSAAERAGLKKGDVITKINDVEITSFTQLRDYIKSIRVETEIEITYMRADDGLYKENKVKTTLGKNPYLEETGQ